MDLDALAARVEEGVYYDFIRVDRDELLELIALARRAEDAEAALAENVAKWDAREWEQAALELVRLERDRWKVRAVLALERAEAAERERDEWHARFDDSWNAMCQAVAEGPEAKWKAAEQTAARLREALETVVAMVRPMEPPADHPIPEPVASVLLNIARAALSSVTSEKGNE